MLPTPRPSTHTGSLQLSHTGSLQLLVIVYKFYMVHALKLTKCESCWFLYRCRFYVKSEWINGLKSDEWKNFSGSHPLPENRNVSLNASENSLYDKLTEVIFLKINRNVPNSNGSFNGWLFVLPVVNVQRSKPFHLCLIEKLSKFHSIKHLQLNEGDSFLIE